MKANAQGAKVTHELRIAILKTGLRQVPFAKEARVSPTTLNLLINGRNEFTPSTRIKTRILTALRAHGWQGRDSEIFP